MITFSVTLRVDTAQIPVVLTGTIAEDNAEAVSEVYTVWHLPTTISPAKSSAETSGPQLKTKTEVQYGDHADNGNVEVLVTIGASILPVTVVVTSPAGAKTATGVSGTTIALALPG